MLEGFCAPLSMSTVNASPISALAFRASSLMCGSNSSSGSGSNNDGANDLDAGMARDKRISFGLRGNWR